MDSGGLPNGRSMASITPAKRVLAKERIIEFMKIRSMALFGKNIDVAGIAPFVEQVEDSDYHDASSSAEYEANIAARLEYIEKQLQAASIQLHSQQETCTGAEPAASTSMSLGAKPAQTLRASLSPVVAPSFVAPKPTIPLPSPPADATAPTRPKHRIDSTATIPPSAQTPVVEAQEQAQTTRQSLKKEVTDSPAAEKSAQAETSFWNKLDVLRSTYLATLSTLVKRVGRFGADESSLILSATTEAVVGKDAHISAASCLYSRKSHIQP